MKIAVFSDVHDNLLRWREAAEIIRAEKIKIGFCCGDLGDLQTVDEVAGTFKTLYLALGNMDFKLKEMTGLFPENLKFSFDFGEIELEKRKIAFVHSNRLAKELTEPDRYDLVFYGHTHTPWEEKIGNTVLLNPGEVAGQFGKASFAIYDLGKMKAELKLLT